MEEIKKRLRKIKNGKQMASLCFKCRKVYVIKILGGDGIIIEWGLLNLILKKLYINCWDISVASPLRKLWEKWLWIEGDT